MPTDDEIKAIQAENKALKDANAELTSEKTKAETAKTIAEAQRATILAQAPPTDAKALEGKVTVDADTTEIQKLAHEAMADAVDEMAAAIRRELNDLRIVVIYAAADLITLANYNTVSGQLALLANGYGQSLKKAPVEGLANAVEMALPLLAPVVAGAAVKSVIDLISLLKTNVDIKGATVTFDDASLVAQVAKALKSQTGSIEVVYSTLYLPGILSAPNSGESNLMKSLQAVSESRQEAELEVTIFDKKEADIKAADPDRKRIADLKALNASLDRLLTGLGEIGDKKNLSALTTLLRGELLAEKMLGKQSAILFIKAVGGGENRTTQNLWSSGKLYHSGTAILTYLLFTIARGLTLSDVISRTTNFKEAKLKPAS